MVTKRMGTYGEQCSRCGDDANKEKLIQVTTTETTAVYHTRCAGISLIIEADTANWDRVYGYK